MIVIFYEDKILCTKSNAFSFYFRTEKKCWTLRHCLNIFLANKERS